MNILIKPVITEKMTDESEKYNRFGFIVDRRANKLEIKDAVEKMYGVSVEKVRTMVYPGKAKSRNTKGGVISGRTNSYKKAIVDVAEGESIDFYGNI
ncbi:MAG: 50S ribosomal protein L23 [Bacteroidetes bacterium MED-G21]|jgi:large subunit ribosomal protein L23|nr:MAG: 50S ribosomal protein L23 [Bacteroidetes bacterium MED-G21]|tara:strand:- start:65 stop:355 length:291 start_codon:yes stop_codon:yes gene_type:complete